VHESRYSCINLKYRADPALDRATIARLVHVSEISCISCSNSCNFPEVRAPCQCIVHHRTRFAHHTKISSNTDLMSRNPDPNSSNTDPISRSPDLNSSNPDLISCTNPKTRAPSPNVHPTPSTPHASLLSCTPSSPANTTSQSERGRG
jgi:hypothetical protein